MRKLITANATNVFMLNTYPGIKTLHVFCNSTSTFSGGTLTLGVRDRGTTDSFITISPVTLGQIWEFPVGNDVEVSYKLTGASAPAIDLMLTVS